MKDVMKQKSKELGAEIRRNMQVYEDIRVNGGSDPAWPDGMNMNLCRNHILYVRKKILLELDREYYPEEYYMDVPPEVDAWYMANADVIREKAKATYEVLVQDENYQYLKKMLPENNQRIRNQLNPVKYVMGLKKAIDGGDLLTMRSCMDPGYYLEYLRESREKVDVMLNIGVPVQNIKEGQMSIWDFIGA